MGIIASVYSTTATGTNTSGVWLLRDPLDPATVLVLPVAEINFDASQDQATFLPLGRTRPVVVQDVARGEVITLTLRFITQADYLVFEVLRKRLRTLLLQSDSLGEQWYVRLSSDRRTSVFAGANRKVNPFRTVQIEATEVDVP